MTVANAYDAIVIGAGANGLVAATVLAKGGKRVLVVNGAPGVGGRSRLREFAPGFRAAPLALDAGWVPPAVARSIGLANVPSATSPHSVAVALGDGDSLALPRDVAGAAAAISKYSPRDASRWPAFVERLRKLSGFLEALYQLPSPDLGAAAPAEILSLLGMGRRYRALGREGMTELLRLLPMPVQDLLDDEFESEALKAALGAGGVRDIHQGPRSGGTTFVLLHYLAGAPDGSVRARSWWRASPEAFNAAAESCARDAGVTIRTGPAVSRVLVRDDAVTGVVLGDAQEIFAPTVVSTVDATHTLLGMVDPVWLDPEFIHAIRNIKFRGCTAFVQYAVDRLPNLPALDAVVSLTSTLTALEQAYDASKYGNISARPHIELTAPSQRWPALGPEGAHVLVAKVQYAPYHLRDGALWDQAHVDALSDSVTAAIGGVLPGFADTVLHRAALSPADIEREFGFTEGAVTQGELTLDQILFMRPVPGHARYAMPVRGLYLGGAGTHPGPGVLGGPGWLAAKQVLQDSR